jgi:predicted nucleic acid-binding protein
VSVITYIDSGVLIAAARGTSFLSDRAMSFLDDPLRTYVTSVFVRLEVLPKSIYHQNLAEIEFYEAFFDSTQEIADDISQVLILAFDEACQNGLSAIDAIHIAYAVLSGAQEFITTEKATKPMHRTKRIKVISITP